MTTTIKNTQASSIEPAREVNAGEQNANIQEKTKLISAAFESGLKIATDKVQIDYQNDHFEFMVRMRQNDGFEALPRLDTLPHNAKENHQVQKLQGATHVLLGTVAFDELHSGDEIQNHITLTMRLVNAETGVIVRAGHADANCGISLSGKKMGMLLKAARQDMLQ